MKIKKLWWLRRFFYNQTYRLVGLRAGPLMLNVYGEYLYIDPYGSIWRITPTGQHEIPLSISLYHKAGFRL